MPTIWIFALSPSLGGVLDYARERPWTFALWVGLGFITISLMILMRTKWGQAKPISKCVVLSVLAHIWLAGYAADTVLRGPVHPREEFEELAVNMVDDEPPEEKSKDEQSPEDQEPWQKIAVDKAEQFDVNSPERQQVGSTETERQAVEVAPTHTMETLPSTIRDSAFKTDVDDESDPVEIPGVRPTAMRMTSAAAAAMQQPTPVPQKAVKAEPMGPVAIQMDRQQTSPAPMAPVERSFNDAEATQPSTTNPGLQKIAARAIDSNAPEFRAAEDDDLAREVALPMARNAASSTVSKASGNAGAAIPLGALPPLPRRLGDGKPLPQSYRIRLAHEQRAKILERLGGNARTEAAVEAALRWLAANQSADGRWDASALEAGRDRSVDGRHRQGAGADADTGITGLVILAFLASGNTHLEGNYRRQVQLGLEFLIERQAANGDLAGNSRLYARMYCHGMAALALSEAYALTGDRRLAVATQRAMQYTIKSQHPTTGGWRYQPGDYGDMSQFGWQAMAIRSAELAGIAIPQTTRDGMLKFMASVSAGEKSGLACYRPNENTSTTMTAEALTCRLLLQMLNEPATVQEAAQYIMKETPKNGNYNLYYWYYATLALHQLQDDSWDTWNQHMQERLLKLQEKEGRLAGSWDPDSRWASYGGRAYSTAMATLCLQVYYRYLPLQKK